MIIAGTGSSTAYDVLVVAHVVTAVVGFGSVLISGVYGGAARRPGRPGAAEELQRYFRSSGVAEYALLAVPFLGAAALGVRPGRREFADLWVVGGLVTWVVAAVVLLVVVRPAEAAIRSAVGAGNVDDARLPGNRLLWGSVVTDALFVAALGFMVTQPR